MARDGEEEEEDKGEKAGEKEKQSVQRVLGKSGRGASEGAFGILIERIEARGAMQRGLA